VHPNAAEAISPVSKQNLSDIVARRVRELIRSGEFRAGDRLPPIAVMARRFGVGAPTLREALKRLEAMRVVEIRHGAGVFVTAGDEPFVLASPDFEGTVTRKLLIDLVRARIPLEMESVAAAARDASDAEIAGLRLLLTETQTRADDDASPDLVDVAFHRGIATASGNSILAQLLDVLRELFTDEQRAMTFGFAAQRHAEHLGIVEALERRDAALAVARMRAHLEGAYGIAVTASAP
jgi:GntR family transcriptional regulator, transcriptional repressor for pyruvate dehydrogenase complex